MVRLKGVHFHGGVVVFFEVLYLLLVVVNHGYPAS